jgi:hypothetical protein
MLPLLNLKFVIKGDPGSLKMNPNLKVFTIGVNEPKIKIEFRNFFCFHKLQIRMPNRDHRMLQRSTLGFASHPHEWHNKPGHGIITGVGGECSANGMMILPCPDSFTWNV